jgi:uncharacterized protein (TIGR02145 family)
LYSAVVNKLTAGGSDTIKFTVIDKSTKANSKNFTVIIRYNRKPNPATLSTPAVNATGVALKPNFTWTDGVDPDGDVVTYTLKYGTTQTNLNQSKTGITVKQYTLATDLTAETEYYWQVVTKTGVNGDSAVSEIWKFTTVEGAPVVTVDPENQKVILGNKATFSVTATGLNLKYQWQRGTSPITGETSKTYTTSALTSSDDNSTYNCIVSNDGGSKTSGSATLSILYGITYDVNSGTGIAPSDTNHYVKGETIIVKEATGLSLTDYGFAGWCRTQNSADTKIYAANDTLKMGSEYVTLYAVWKTVYSVIYNSNGGGNAGGHGIGTEPTDMKKYIQGSTVSVLTNSEGLTYTGYVLEGWNTQADGKGTTYIPGTTTGTFTMGVSNVILYARWVIKDASGNLYTEIKIGDQIWMIENLRTSKFNDSTNIPVWTSATAAATDASFYPGDKPYGAFYNGYAAADTDNLLAPSGWHVATANEWSTLNQNVDRDPRAIASKEYWKSGSTTENAPGNNPSNNNYTGFTAVPSGYFDTSTGTVQGRGESTTFWDGSSIRDYADNMIVGSAHIIGWDNSEVAFAMTVDLKGNYYSVRCVRDY